MKIVEPKAEIIEDELSQLSIYQRIDRCASVCYQRPPKPTEEEAQEFCRKMIGVKHMSTLEMEVVHLVIDHTDAFIPESKFIIKEPLNNFDILCTGSIRAFLECELGVSAFYFLNKHIPVLFPNYPEGAYTNFIRFAKTQEIPWQHKHVAVQFIVNRAVSHELVRHRPCSFLQESQRYCRYEDDVVFVRPEWCSEDWTDNRQSEVFGYTCEVAETQYKILLAHGLKPQQARAVLPNSTKTELIAYASMPQWKHMFNLRCSPAADPEMRRVMIPLREEFKMKYPEMWEGE